MKIIMVAAGGCVGALLRYWISGLTYRVVDGGFPWGTLAVNLLGCFLMGFLWVVFERTIFPPEARDFLFIGLLGALTTFSTFGFETVNLLRDGEFVLALGNILMNNLLGIGFVLTGMALAGKLWAIFR